MYNTSHKQIKYIIDANLFPEYEYKLTSAIKTSGMLGLFIRSFKSSYFLEIFLKDFTNEGYHYVLWLLTTWYNCF